MPDKITIGQLDKRIVIESYTVTYKTDGQQVQTWSTFATAWAKREDGNSITLDSERFEADRNTAIGFTKFTIRYLSGLDKKMRVSYDSKYFDIVAINDNGRKQFIELMTQQRE